MPWAPPKDITPESDKVKNAIFAQDENTLCSQKKPRVSVCEKKHPKPINIQGIIFQGLPPESREEKNYCEGRGDGNDESKSGVGSQLLLYNSISVLTA